MTRQRIGEIPYVKEGVCRHCGIDVKKPRRNWCSQACVTAALIIKGDPVTVRREVLARDKGICASCGFDAEQADRLVHAIRDRGRLPKGWYTLPEADRSQLQAIQSAAHAELRDILRPLWLRWTGTPRASHLWEADHIVPVVEDGGGCGLDGYRTLCMVCHKAATAELARRRAAAKRARTAADRFAAWAGRSTEEITTDQPSDAPSAELPTPKLSATVESPRNIQTADKSTENM